MTSMEPAVNAISQGAPLAWSEVLTSAEIRACADESACCGCCAAHEQGRRSPGDRAAPSTASPGGRKRRGVPGLTLRQGAPIAPTLRLEAAPTVGVGVGAPHGAQLQPGSAQA